MSAAVSGVVVSLARLFCRVWLSWEVRARHHSRPQRHVAAARWHHGRHRSPLPLLRFACCTCSEGHLAWTVRLPYLNEQCVGGSEVILGWFRTLRFLTPATQVLGL